MSVNGCNSLHYELAGGKIDDSPPVLVNSNFRVLEAVIKKYKNPLVLCDVDLTLLMPDPFPHSYPFLHPYGGAPLWNWVRDRTMQKLNLDEKRAVQKMQIFTDYLNRIGKSIPVQKSIPEIIKRLQAKCLTIMACSSRSPTTEQEVRSHLKKIGICFDQVPHFEERVILDGTQEAIKAVYSNGLMLTGYGLSKGDAVHRLLTSSQKSDLFDAIIHIDDLFANFTSTQTTAINMQKQYTAVLYTAAAEKNLVITDAEAKVAINKAIELSSPEFDAFRYLVD